MNQFCPEDTKMLGHPIYESKVEIMCEIRKVLSINEKFLDLTCGYINISPLR